MHVRRTMQIPIRCSEAAKLQRVAKALNDRRTRLFLGMEHGCLAILLQCDGGFSEGCYMCGHRPWLSYVRRSQVAQRPLSQERKLTSTADACRRTLEVQSGREAPSAWRTRLGPESGFSSPAQGCPRVDFRQRRIWTAWLAAGAMGLLLAPGIQHLLSLVNRADTGTEDHREIHPLCTGCWPFTNLRESSRPWSKAKHIRICRGRSFWNSARRRRLCFWLLRHWVTE